MIEYDPVKDVENICKHGFPLETALLLFDGPFVEEVDTREDYNETRFIAMGPMPQFGSRIFDVVYTWREAVRRIISFRKANDREIRKYRSSLT